MLAKDGGLLITTKENKVAVSNIVRKQTQSFFYYEPMVYLSTNIIEGHCCSIAWS